jgi:adenine-specific DNA-methyltransferase
VIKYIGSKRTLVPRILAYAKAIRERTGAGTFLDAFTGTTRVAQALKRAHFRVTANDLASYSEILAIAYIEADANEHRGPLTAAKIGHLNALPGRDGYFTQTFCVDSRYFQPGNGRRIDAIREEIDRISDDRVERAILLTSLLEAADRVDSTTGLQMAYLKDWAPRSFNAMELRMPLLIPGAGVALRGDANALVAEMAPVDIAYLDPPYNQHSYFSNYHIWETLVRDDSPESYGVARKRIDCRVTKSDYNAKGRSWAAFESLVRTIPAKHLIVSFSNEGYFAHDDLVALLESRFREVEAVPVDFRRYVGAQIGIHNSKGEKVGRVSHLTNQEFLFVAGPDAGRIVTDATATMAGAA